MRNTWVRHLCCCCITTAAALLAGCGAPSTADIPAVTPFDGARYMGQWYEIARLPQSYEEGLSAVQAEYTLQDNGDIRVVNSGEDAEGIRHTKKATATFAGDRNVGELDVRFFWPFYGKYRIIALDPEYSIAVVTGSRRDALWILSRTPSISADALQQRIDQAKKWGFAVDQLIVEPGTPHEPY